MYVLCIAEGLAPVQGDSLVARRTMPGAWRITDPARLLARWQVLTLLPSLAEVVPLERRVDSAEPGMLASVGYHSPWPWRAEFALMFGRLMGALVLLLLVLGVPIATQRFGVIGLVMAVCVILNLSMLTSVLLAVLERYVRLVAGLPPRLERIPLRSPFAIPVAAGTMRARVLGELSRAEVVKRLLAPAAWREWVRPAVFDEGGEPRDASARVPEVAVEIARTLGHEERARIVAAPSGMRATERFCPRCGALFAMARAACSDCGVGLAAG